MSSAIVIAGMSLINLLIRCPVFILARRLRLPKTLEQALSFTPVAVLTAFIVPSTLHLDVAPGGEEVLNPDLIAALASAAVSWFTGRLMLTIVVGLVTAIGLRFVL